MMKKTDIMITDLKKVVENPIDIGSEIFSSFSNELVNSKKISAVMWISKSKNRCSVWNSAITEFKFHVKNNLNEYFTTWFVIADSVWQKDTPIMRKKSVIKRALSIKNIRSCKNRIIENNNMIKYFSAFKIDDSFEFINNESIIHGYDVYIIALEKDKDIDLLLENGWETQELVNEILLNRTIKMKGSIARFFGRFDDNESGLMAFHSSRYR